VKPNKFRRQIYILDLLKNKQNDEQRLFTVSTRSYVFISLLLICPSIIKFEILRKQCFSLQKTSSLICLKIQDFIPLPVEEIENKNKYHESDVLLLGICKVAPVPPGLTKKKRFRRSNETNFHDIKKAGSLMK